jgi:orotidine-5'-phosphate decarboxylase
MAAARENLSWLDFATPRDASTRDWHGDTVSFYKSVGTRLRRSSQDLIRDGKQVFLILSCNIPATVSRACTQVAGLGARFLTVHAYSQTMRAAKLATAGSSLRLLGVTVLTSCDDMDLADAGYAFGVQDLVVRRAAQACEEGIDGLILSAGEARAIHASLGRKMILVTPGIRPEARPPPTRKSHNACRRDSRRGGLPGRRPAGRAGKNPREAAEAIVAEIATPCPATTRLETQTPDVPPARVQSWRAHRQAMIKSLRRRLP